RAACGIEAARAAAHDQDIWVQRRRAGWLRVFTISAGNRFGEMALTPDRHGLLELGHAGALIGDAIDLHQAFLADAHAAEYPAGLLAAREAHRADAGGGQGRGQALAAPAAQALSLELDCDPVGLREFAA